MWGEYFEDREIYNGLVFILYQERIPLIRDGSLLYVNDGAERIVFSRADMIHSNTWKIDNEGQLGYRMRYYSDVPEFRWKKYLVKEWKWEILDYFGEPNQVLEQNLDLQHWIP